MPHAIVRRLALPSLIIALASSSAYPQSGSTGGSIGNGDKALSGSRSDRSAEPAPSASPRRSKPASNEPRRSGGGGAADGAWVVTSIGCGGTASGAIVVTSGRIIGDGLTGSVSANGAARSVYQANGLTSIGSGRLSGRSGAGTFRRSDGCSGTWSAIKQ